MAETTIDQLGEALENTRGRMPAEILRAFLPEKQTVFGGQLVPLTAGHHLVLVHLGHPLVLEGRAWSAEDIPLAMFVFTRPSDGLFRAISDGTFEGEFFAYLESLPCAEMGGAIQALVGHWLASTEAALAMQSPHPATQKKTAVSVGG